MRIIPEEHGPSDTVFANVPYGLHPCRHVWRGFYRDHLHHTHIAVLGQADKLVGGVTSEVIVKVHNDDSLPL